MSDDSSRDGFAERPPQRIWQLAAFGLSAVVIVFGVALLVNMPDGSAVDPSRDAGSSRAPAETTVATAPRLSSTTVLRTTTTVLPLWLVTETVSLGGSLNEPWELVQVEDSVWAIGLAQIDFVDPVERRSVGLLVFDYVDFWVRDSEIWFRDLFGDIDVLDTASLSFDDSIVLGMQPSYALEVDGSMWVAGVGGIVIVDLDSRVVTRVADVDSCRVDYLLRVGDSIWYSDQCNGVVGEVDIASRTLIDVVDRIDFGYLDVGFRSAESNMLLKVGSSVWLTNDRDGTVTVIDTFNHLIEDTIEVGAGPVGLLLINDTVFVANESDNTVSAISVLGREVVDTIAVGDGPEFMAELYGSLWVANLGDRQTVGTVTVIDPRTRRVTASLEVGIEPTFMLEVDGAAWVSNRMSESITIIERS